MPVKQESPDKTKLPKCKYQFVAGEEPPCCTLLWASVLNGPGGFFFEKRLEKGIAPTACEPGILGRICFGEDD